MQLETSMGLAATNSPMLVDHREPRLVDGRLEVVYSFILENIGRDPIDIDLSAVEVVAGDAKGNVACSVRGHRVPSFSLAPSARWRVDCRLTFARETTALLGRQDIDATLILPLKQAHEELHFIYRLRIEDAS
jgi:hypothetical protein